MPLPRLDELNGKKILAAIFDRSVFTDKIFVDIWLEFKGYFSDLYKVDDSNDNYRVLFPGPALSEFDQNTFERVPSGEAEGPDEGVTYVIGSLHRAFEFDDRPGGRHALYEIPMAQYAAANEPTLKFAEETEFMALYTGTFKHFGSEIIIDRDMLDTMAQNFKKDVLRKGPLPIDYSHNNFDRAAGWIQEVRLKDVGGGRSELWVRSRWTPAGKKALEDQEFRFFSAEFETNYRDNETGEEFGPTLRGGGLTNIPFLKLPPVFPLAQMSQEDRAILFSENQDRNQNQKTEDEEMKFKNLDEAQQHIEKLNEKVVELSQGASDVKQLTEEVKQLREDNQALKKEKQLAEKNQKFEAMLSQGKAVEAQRKPFMADDMIAFAEAAVKTNPATKGVPAGGAPTGGGESGDPNNNTPEEEYELTELEKRYLRFATNKDPKHYIKVNNLTGKSTRPQDD